MEQARRLGDGNTTQQLKHDIDSGRTGSKNDTADPGLAALGTCDEAAGTPPTPERVALAREQENRIGRLATAGDRPATNGPLIAIVGVVVVVAVVVVAYFLAR